MAEVHLAQGIQLLIGTVHIRQAIHEPGIAQRIVVVQRNGLAILQRHDDIAHIKHVEHGPDAIALDLGHFALSRSHGAHQPLHLRCDVSINQFLIAAQLGSVIAADALMVIARLVLIERTLRKVQYAIVTAVALVLQDKLIGLGQLLCGLALALRHKHVVVQIALVHLPHINKTQHDDGTNHIFALQFLGHEQQQAHGAYQDNGERTPGIGCEHGLAHFGKIIENRSHILLRQLMQCLGFL